MMALRFAHFANWHAPLAGDWESYLAGRPGDLRETIRRRLARAARDPAIGFELVTGDTMLGGAALTDGIAAYEAVYARSWKQPEPFPGFLPPPCCRRPPPKARCGSACCAATACRLPPSIGCW